MQPMIGIPPSFNYQKNICFVHQDYYQSIIRAGGIPFIFPITTDEKLLDTLIKKCDGILFIGGDDIDPALYNEVKLPICGELSPVRDEMELYIMKKVIQNKMPFAAICRGFELLNVALKGTLYQDLATQFSDEILHPQYHLPAEKVHDMEIVKDTQLYDIFQNTFIQVNSRHHQGVKEVGENLIVNARSKDDLVEGIEMKKSIHPFGVAVQWHPEALSSNDEGAQRFFDTLILNAKEYEHDR